MILEVPEDVETRKFREMEEERRKRRAEHPWPPFPYWEAKQ